MKRSALFLALLAASSAPGAADARPGRAPAVPTAPALLAGAIERRLHSDSVEASSFLWNDWNKFVENYHPNYVADDDPATAWVEGAKGSGAGEWLRIQTTPLDHTTRVRLRIRNGYQKSKDLWKANARARDVTVRLLPSQTVKQITLSDTDGWQEVAIDQPDGVVSTVELAIKTAYEGTKYEDLCISDVQVFATSRVADNPAFEKVKHGKLMAWRAARLAVAATFKAQRVQLPVYPAYEVTASEIELGEDGEISDMIAAAGKDSVFGKEWKDALGLATESWAHRDELPRAQIAPATRDKLLASDGLQLVGVENIAGEGGAFGYYNEGTLRLPLLDYVSTMFADQLRMLDVKDATKVSAFVGAEGRCTPDLSWVKRSAPKDQSAPAQVQAILIGRCARVPIRTGSFNARVLELYVYDPAGRLVLSVANGHIDGYRWITDNGRPMLAGGRALLAQGKVIEAKKREAVAVK